MGPQVPLARQAGSVVRGTRSRPGAAQVSNPSPGPRPGAPPKTFARGGISFGSVVLHPASFSTRSEAVGVGVRLGHAAYAHPIEAGVELRAGVVVVADESVPRGRVEGAASAGGAGVERARVAVVAGLRRRRAVADAAGAGVAVRTRIGVVAGRPVRLRGVLARPQAVAFVVGTRVRVGRACGTVRIQARIVGLVTRIGTLRARRTWVSRVDIAAAGVARVH